MRLGTANIRNYPDMPFEFVAEDAKTIGKRTVIWGGQEIKSGEDTPVVLEALNSLKGSPLKLGGKAKWSAIYPNFETPIFYRSDLFHKPYDLQFHKSDRADLPVTNKNTAITSGVFEFRNRPHLNSFAFVNAHLISGAHNKHRQVPRRQEFWQREFDALSSLITYHYSENRTVFFVMDSNNPHCPLPHKNARWLHDEGIDKIGVLEHPRGLKVGKGDGGLAYEMHSDHDCKVVKVRIGRNA